MGRVLPVTQLLTSRKIIEGDINDIAVSADQLANAYIQFARDESLKDKFALHLARSIDTMTTEDYMFNGCRARLLKDLKVGGSLNWGCWQHFVNQLQFEPNVANNIRET